MGEDRKNIEKYNQTRSINAGLPKMVENIVANKYVLCDLTSSSSHTATTVLFLIVLQTTAGSEQ